MEGEEERESNDDILKYQVAIRCAKAAFLLSSLRSPGTLTTKDNYEERDRLLRDIADLKIELVKERFKNKQMRFCSLLEIILQILVLLSFATFCLILINESA